MLGSQRPIRANDRTHRTCPAPPSSRRSAARSTSPAATVPIQVSHSRTSSNPLDELSTSARKPSKWRTRAWVLGVPLLDQPVLEAVELALGGPRQVSHPGPGKSSRNSANATSMTNDQTDLARPAAPPRRGRRDRRGGDLPLATAIGRPRPRHGLSTVTRSTTPTTSAVLDHRTGLSLRRDHGTASLTVVERRARPSALAGRGGAHDPAQGEHLFARDVADEVPYVVVGGRADELLGRAELHDAPSRIIAIRSPSRSASARSWVMKTIVRPSRAAAG